jgi:hypothetical protein
MRLGFSPFGQALFALFVILEPGFSQSAPAIQSGRSPSTQMATYVLDVDTNIKGEFGSIAPQLTEALQTAFSEKRDVFKILERRHLDQLVRANRLEKDLQALSRGEPTSAQFVRQIRADAFIRGELVDGSDGVVLTVTLVNLNSEVMWEGQARESRAGWLLHETQTKNAAKLAEEAEAHFRPSSSGQQTDRSTAVVRKVQPPNPMPGVFDSLEYEMSAENLHKSHDGMYFDVIAQTHDDKPMRIYIAGCYVLDENGARWDSPPGTADSGHLTQDAVLLIPGTKLRSRFQFIAKGSADGSKFSFICTEMAPRGGRMLIVPNIPAR